MSVSSQFGAVSVEIDDGNETVRCVIDDPRVGIRQPWLHSLEEIAETYQTMRALAAVDPVARDFAQALQYAARLIKAKREVR